ncbi:MAG: DNA repair protein RecO [Woeseia sp.]|nr:DNA repair protein RecO [Woeseia sp.]MBT8097064.1 DNA repair protein RecO [Woeseia sp.]NNE62080.1 DNA repair protein RecO [Woeseia sp.]NNL54325.1 DNA repair protein RecO [Woeseia sp.]
MTMRIQQEPAWLLHHRPFRDSSRILDILSRDHGRLSLVARGARSAKSRLNGLLRPFMPLSMSWVARGDLGTLTGAEMDGAPVALSGDALLSGYYANELLLKLLHRFDPQPEVFALYARTVGKLAGNKEPALLLRQFEIELLGFLGYGLNLDRDVAQHHELLAKQHYEYRVALGAMPVDRQAGPMVFSGEELIAIRDGCFADRDKLRAASRLLRGVIAYHLDGKELMSRKVLQELRRRPQVAPTASGSGHEDLNVD